MSMLPILSRLIKITAPARSIASNNVRVHGYDQSAIPFLSRLLSTAETPLPDTSTARPPSTDAVPQEGPSDNQQASRCQTQGPESFMIHDLTSSWTTKPFSIPRTSITNLAAKYDHKLSLHFVSRRGDCLPSEYVTDPSASPAFDTWHTRRQSVLSNDFNRAGCRIRQIEEAVGVHKAKCLDQTMISLKP